MLLCIAVISSFIKIFPPDFIIEIQNWADGTFSTQWTLIFAFLFDGVFICSIIMVVFILPLKLIKGIKLIKHYITVAKKYKSLSLESKLLLQKFVIEGFPMTVSKDTPNIQELFDCKLLSSMYRPHISSIQTPCSSQDIYCFIPDSSFDAVTRLVDKDKLLRL